MTDAFSANMSDLMTLRWHKSLPQIWCSGGPACFGMSKSGWSPCQVCGWEPSDSEHLTTKNALYLCPLCFSKHHGETELCNGRICGPLWASIAAAYRAMDIDTTARAPGTPPRGPWQWQARSSAGASPSSAAASRGPQPPPPGLPPLSSASASSTNSSADMKDLSDRVHVVEHKLQKNPPEKLDDQIMCLDERIKTLENFDNIRIKMLETKLLEYEDRMKSLLEEEEKKNDKQIKFLTDMVDKMSEELASCRDALIRMETRPPAGSVGSSHSSDLAAMVAA